MKSPPLFCVGDDVVHRPTLRTGRVFSVKESTTTATGGESERMYVLLYGTVLTDVLESDLTLQKRAPRYKSKEPSPLDAIPVLVKRAAAKLSDDRTKDPHEVLAWYGALVAILSGKTSGCMYCAHLELTTMGRKTVCPWHGPNLPLGATHQRGCL